MFFLKFDELQKWTNSKEIRQIFKKRLHIDDLSPSKMMVLLRTPAFVHDILIYENIGRLPMSLATPSFWEGSGHKFESCFDI